MNDRISYWKVWRMVYGLTMVFYTIGILAGAPFGFADKMFLLVIAAIQSLFSTLVPALILWGFIWISQSIKEARHG